MKASTEINITMSNVEREVIENLVDTLEHLPCELTNDDYCQIIWAISNKWVGVDILNSEDSINFEYTEFS